MTLIILIALLTVALAASLSLNWWQKAKIKHLSSRYKQLYEQTEMVATDVNPVERWVKEKPTQPAYDVDDYSDLTSAQRHKIGGRS